jgi:septum formation protein
VVLASASPRRRELLAQLLERFDVVPASVDEEALTDPDPWVTAQRLAREKALAVFGERGDALVIGGDTVVAIETGAGWRQLAKPADESDAARMLRELSGRTHVVVTGVCLVWPGGMSAFTEASRVTFRELGDEEIARYVATGSPMDKAGAYGLQDASQDFVARVEGGVDNVIGLPLARLREALQSVTSQK